MEITDLQINDWVYDKSFTPSNFPCRIYSIEGRYPRRDKDFNDKPLIDVWVGDGFLTSHIENIEPIPLTAEILAKNGFMQVEDGVQEYNFPEGIWQNDSLLCGLDYNERGMFYTFSCNPEEDGLINQIYGIFYVHQLQHALRLCGLNELADNFKV